MILAANETVEMVWDLRPESLTLGGALVLRQEGEILASIRGRSEVTMHLPGAAFGEAGFERLSQAVFHSSSYRFELRSDEATAAAWPDANQRRQPEYSSFSYTRVAELFEKTRIAPSLSWDALRQERATAARSAFSGKLVCLHVRRTAPFALEESNADLDAWSVFLRQHARPQILDFMLLGDDVLPEHLARIPGVHRATHLELATQLALISFADGFIGMASGLSTAASFSPTPHVILKHPSHHPEAMYRELGTADRFNFNRPRQWLWRRLGSAPQLTAALSAILP